MIDVFCVPTSYDEYIAMVKTGNERQLSAVKAPKSTKPLAWGCLNGVTDGSKKPRSI